SNKTGLTGGYDFTLQYSNGDPPPPDSTAPSIYTAIEEQGGLKLESAKGPVKVLVIAHAERAAARRGYVLAACWAKISRRVSPAAVRLAVHISTYSRESTTPSAPAAKAAWSACF